MSAKDGGPAFPTLEHSMDGPSGFQHHRRIEHTTVGGMSLRDYFAGQALTGLVGRDGAWGAWYTEAGDNIDDDFGRTCAGYAQAAYELADSMLAARGEQP